MDEDGLPIVGSGVDLTKVSVVLTEANRGTALQNEELRLLTVLQQRCHPV